MAKKIKKEEGEGASVWLTTYSDLMTLMFVFFVLLFSMSSINPVKWDILVQTYGNRDRTVSAVGGVEDSGDIAEAIIIEYIDNILAMLDEIDSEGDPWDDIAASELQDIMDFDVIYEMLVWHVDVSGYSELVDIEKDENYIMIRFADKVFFQSGMAIIGAEGRELIEFVGHAIQLILDQVDMIKIEGHTDSIPQTGGVHPDNWALSQERARQVLLLLEGSGVPTDRPLLQPTGLADTVPRAENDTPEGRSQNRRVEIYITRKHTVVETAAEDYYGGETEEAAGEESEAEEYNVEADIE
ncbi:MAG: flagellar motor protein MotB [Oscillospiraceae bacterium]|nr:flagellar motor protein MotB [Oscillospiraceae bacterium]